MGERGIFGGPQRRVFLAGAAATLTSWPLAARAQGKMRRIGVLLPFLANDSVGQADATALLQGLGALDWHEGANLHIDRRWGRQRPGAIRAYATELLALGPEVVLAVGTPSVMALRRSTRTIPIVFTLVSDPVGQGFVESLGHPGGNITGFSLYDPPMAGKWLQMLTQISPPVVRVAVLYKPGTGPFFGLMLSSIWDAASSLAMEVRAAPVSDDAEIEAIMAGLAREEHGSLLVLPTPFTGEHREAIVELATRYRLPAVYPFRSFAVAGGLMYYGVDIQDPMRRSATYIDRLLKGEKPADLPVQRPSKFELVLNQKTAATLGVTFAPSLLAGADEVIE